MKRPILQRTIGLAALILLAAFSPVLAKKGGNKPGGGGEDPPPNPAPVEYQLTWIPGINDGQMHIYDCNTAGIAVGSYQDDTGTYRPFCTTADGVITPLDDWWALPPGYEGWRVGGRLAEMQINEANEVCGIIANDQIPERQLFLANLSDPNSLVPVGPVHSGKPRYIYMNEHGDIASRMAVGNGGTLQLYVRSLDKMFEYEQDLRGFTPTGINDNLQVSLVYSEFTSGPTGPLFHGSGLLSFDVATETGMFDDLGIAETIFDPMTVPWGGINNAGTVFGYFETRKPRIRLSGGNMVSRTANTTAGFIAAGSATWTELDTRLPTGGTLVNQFRYDAAACALGVNEFGQIVGGYQCGSRYFSENLWLLDPEDGLFDVNDLVVGDPAEVEAFRAANGFNFVRITEIDPETGYGIISGSASWSGPGFILTPHLIEQP